MILANDTTIDAATILNHAMRYVDTGGVYPPTDTLSAVSERFLVLGIVDG